MSDIHREVIESIGEEVTIRVPRELLGQRVEILMNVLDTGEERVKESPAEPTPDNRTPSRKRHPSWTPELVELMYQVAGSMPGLERGPQHGEFTRGEREWPTEG